MGKTYQCRFCGKKWEARVKKPAACPKCKRYGYDDPPKVKGVKEAKR